MSALTGPALVVAGLLLIAGAQKLLDPTMTVGALRSLGVQATPGLVRAGSAAEVCLGAAAVVSGSPVIWWLAAASYLAFNVVVGAALRRGTMIGSCGCFGREETPPHWSHLVLNCALGGTAAAIALGSTRAPVDELGNDPAAGAVVVALAALALYLLHTLYVEVPRVLVGSRPGERHADRTS